MSNLRETPRWRPPWWAVALLVPLLTVGCGDKIKRVPVAGQVLLGGQPLRGKTGSILFRPDESRGNTSPLEAVGSLDAEGGYVLFTKGKKGAPPGWYTVVVTATEPYRRQDKGDMGPPSPINVKYSRETTTDLRVEVAAKPAPGAYDLNLTE